MNWDQVQDEWMQLRAPAGKTIRRKMEGVIECVSIPALLLGIRLYLLCGELRAITKSHALSNRIDSCRPRSSREAILSWPPASLPLPSPPARSRSGSKIFLLMGLACIAASATVFAAFRTQPLPTTISCGNRPREATIIMQ